MYKITLLICINIISCLAVKAKHEMKNFIADSLRENAVAIVNNYEATFSQSDINNGTYKVKKTITILNKQGEQYGHFYEYGDKFRELKDFSGVVKNVSGMVIKKIGKKDLIISSMSEHMATDNYYIIYECKSPTFPYTVEYTYQEKWKNGIIAYPSFMPIENYMQSVENASYTIELPENKNLRYNSNFACDIKEETINGRHTYTFSAKGLKAISYEPLSPALREVVPRVLIAPSDFCYDSYCGNMSDWKSYGLWVSGLLKNRDVLPIEMVTKLKELTKDAKNNREKVEILYKYLQDNSRYVSIQLGIGGLQPIEAASVAKSGFGDCKGLSNEMKALLNAVDIKSNYCEISMREKYLHTDFTNVTQTDHAILLVPLEKDSIWLECTSQTLPYGYIHDKIAGHDALVINDDGGTLCRLPNYSDQENKKCSKLEISISEDGTAKGKMFFTEYLHGYASNVQAMRSNDREEVTAYINKNIRLPKIQISNISATEERTSLPSCMLSADFAVSDFANKTGTRLFIQASPLTKINYNILSANSRSMDINIDNGFSESDSITYTIPITYKLETIPKNISLKTLYGTFEANFKLEENKIIYTQDIDVYSGKYDKSKYEEIKAFFAKIASATRSRLVLRKS